MLHSDRVLLNMLRMQRAHGLAANSHRLPRAMVRWFLYRSCPEGVGLLSRWGLPAWVRIPQVSIVPGRAERVLRTMRHYVAHGPSSTLLSAFHKVVAPDMSVRGDRQCRMMRNRQGRAQGAECLPLPLRRHQLGWSHMAACAQEHEVPRGFEPRSLDSESRVLAAAPRDQVKFDSQEMGPLHNLGN